jgi:Zn-dependent peptidase ImmA (M78 family)
MNYTKQTRNSPLGNLRALIPERPLRWSEAVRLAELQANHLRRQLGITSPELPEGALTNLSRIRVIELDDLPSSGVTHWHNGTWVIAINSQEPWTRQRFSLAHEIFHAINYPTEQWLCWPEYWRSAATKSEKLAEYFGGCLLMPKNHVKRLSGEGLDPGDLADTFGVSLRAVEVRLSQLQVRDPRRRCGFQPRSGRFTASQDIASEEVAA